MGIFWLDPRQVQDPACLASVLTIFISFSGKAPDQQADSATSDPAWVTMVKQRQKNFPAHIPVKELETKTRVEAKAETIRPKHEVGPGAAHKTLQKFVGAN